MDETNQPGQPSYYERMVKYWTSQEAEAMRRLEYARQQKSIFNRALGNLAITPTEGENNA